MNKESTKPNVTNQKTEINPEMLIARLDRLTDLLEQAITKNVIVFSIPKPSGIRPMHNRVYLPEVLTFLDIKKTAFYDNVWKRLLHPIKIGGRSYYIREEMEELLRRHKENHTPYRLLEPIEATDLKKAA